MTIKSWSSPPANKIFEPQSGTVMVFCSFCSPPHIVCVVTVTVDDLGHIIMIMIPSGGSLG
jgi:hypothetical protein